MMSEQTDAVPKTETMPRSRKVGILLLALLVTIYVILLTHVSWRRFDGQRMGAYDLGIFDAATWLISQGKSPTLTLRGMHLLGDHFSVILYGIAPLYWLFPTPKTLLTVQSLALGLGAVPIYRLALRHTLRVEAAVVFAFAYLMHPTIAGSNLAEFHPDTLALPLLLSALDAFDARYWRLYTIALLLTCLVKEVAGISVIAVGMVVLYSHPKRGLATVAGGLIAIFLSMATLKHFAPDSPSGYITLYSQYGTSPLQIVFRLITHPPILLKALFSPAGRGLLTALLSSLAFLPLFAPEVAFWCLPPLLVTLLPSYLLALEPTLYYWCWALPLLLYASMIGFSRLQRIGNRATFVVLCILLPLFACAGILNLPSWNVIRTSDRVRPPQARTDLMAILAHIPLRASISAQQTSGAFLTHRERLYLFPNPFYRVGTGAGKSALDHFRQTNYPRFSCVELSQNLQSSDIEYLLIEIGATHFPLSDELYAQCVETVLASPAYGIIAHEGHNLLLQRGADHSAGIGLLKQILLPFGTRAHTQRANSPLDF